MITPGRRQLLIDDYIVQGKLGVEKHGVMRTVDQPPKYAGNLTVRPLHTWEANIIISGTVMYEPEQEIYTMWYMAGPHDAPFKACYATSRDGIHWEKPIGTTGSTNYCGPIGGLETALAAGFRLEWLALR